MNELIRAGLLHLVFLLTLVILGSPFAANAEPPPILEPLLKDSDRQHWAFLKPERPALPKTIGTTWARNPIDSFILGQLEKQASTPSNPAEKLTLLRRITFDLTGLPPTISEIDGYLNDDRLGAYERVVDRLLASPHYGERWAQHWLDLVRYAESNGYEVDGERPSAWRYRDYVVRSFNEDKPFDRFLTEQIAGDELAAGKDARDCTDLWVATGFHRCGPIHIVSGNTDPEENRHEVLTEMVTGIGSTFLGLSINCARCHDHKFDPISQADYYRLEAFFASTWPKDINFAAPAEQSGYQLKLLGALAKVAPVKARLAALDAPYQEKIRHAKRARLEPRHRDALDANSKSRTPEQERLAHEAETLLKVTWDEIVAAMPTPERERRAVMRSELHTLEAELPTPPAQAWAVADDGKAVPTHLLQRGDVKKKGARVEPAFLRVLEPGGAKQRNARLTRTNLAAWLIAPENPLTARVFVNRLWQHHFGRGLVATPNDFGARGARPTHPELLDWLAVELMRSGWKVKPLHRLMVLSSTYRQASTNSNGASSDPDNQLLGKMNRRRLEGEAIRDSMLAAAGTLNHDLGGPMIRVPLEREVYDLIFTEDEPDGLWPVTADVKQHTRRSLYLFAKRNVRLPLFDAFDQPDRLSSCAARNTSTFAPQALILMNGPLARAQSRSLAVRLMTDHSNEPERWIEDAYHRCFGRPPRTPERILARTFIREQTAVVTESLRSGLKIALPDNLPAKADPATATALADFCLALFNANEFVYVP